MEKILNDFPTLTTERLILREISDKDADAIYQILSNPAVIQYDTFELFQDIKQAHDLIAWFQSQIQAQNAIFWGITLIGRPEVIGFCKCEIEIPEVRADLGYDLNADYWNRGIMTEAIGAVVDFAFRTLQIHRIEATASIENPASIKILEKVGFMREGVMRERCLMGGRYHDMQMLSILKREYLFNV